MVTVWWDKKVAVVERWQRAKKVVSRYPGAIVDFAVAPVNSVFKLPNGQLMFFEEFNQQKNCEINFASQQVFGAI